jgi:ABC-type phosphate/phosphonate transport system substrate-binding protein
VRGDLPANFKQRLVEVLQNVDLTGLPEADRKIMGVHGMRTVVQNDASFNDIRELVKTLNIDLEKMN